MTDVFVVGDGLAGSMAAIAAARRAPSASVTLVASGEPASSAPAREPKPVGGLVDVLGYTPAGDGPLTDPFAAIPDLPAAHPYRTVGVDAVREGLALFDDVTGGAYGGDGSERNALVPTAWGRLRPTARYPDAVAAGLASDQRATSLVGFDALPAFDAPLAAERLSGRLPYRINGLTVEFPVAPSPGQGPLDRTPIAWAQAFDDAEEGNTESETNGESDTDTDGTAKGVVEGLFDELEIYLGAKERVGFPAVLGVAHAGRVRERLASWFGLDVFEVPLGPPSCLGRRLGRVLADALTEAGVDVTTATVDGVEASRGRVEGLVLDGDVHPAEAFVLATGGLAEGGIAADRDGVREPVFGCHVDAPADRSTWADPRPFGRHEFARFGVDVDESLCPLTERGRPVFENLRAAGRILGGHDAVAEGSAGGVAVATGRLAGRIAAADA